MAFTKKDALYRAKQWANETGKTHVVYRDYGTNMFLATSLERYENDPQGYKDVKVIEIVKPDEEN